MPSQCSTLTIYMAEGFPFPFIFPAPGTFKQANDMQVLTQCTMAS